MKVGLIEAQVPARAGVELARKVCIGDKQKPLKRFRVFVLSRNYWHEKLAVLLENTFLVPIVLERLNIAQV